jgi:hypothetical protein
VPYRLHLKTIEILQRQVTTLVTLGVRQPAMLIETLVELGYMELGMRRYQFLSGSSASVRKGPSRGASASATPPSFDDDQAGRLLSIERRPPKRCGGRGHG